VLIVALPPLPYRERGGAEYTFPPHQFGEIMATPESLVKKKIRAILDEAGAYYAMPIGSGYGNAGVPDFLICCNGKFIGVEAKAGTNKATALQEKNIQKIFDAGGIALVINEYTIPELQELIKWTMKL